MRNLIKTLVVMLMLSFSHAAIADDLEDGFAAAQKGNFAAVTNSFFKLILLVRGFNLRK